MWTLVSLRTFTLSPMLVTMRALQRHLAAVQLSEDDRRDVAARLHKANIPTRLLDQVLAAMERGKRDPIRTKLDYLFSMQDGLATRFFDHRGRLRVKKLPLLPDLRALRVTAFRHPETVHRRLGVHPQGLSVTAADAYHLTAICLKAAFPTQFRTLTGEGIKQAIASDRAMQRRPPHQRPRYRRVWPSRPRSSLSCRLFHLRSQATLASRRGPQT
jgi:hypothetical protein